MTRYYIYKLTFESGATYIGQHTQNKENDYYITSSSYYKKHKDDKLINREIILDVPDRKTLDIMETICILSDKADNENNVNYQLGGWLGMENFAGWNKGLKRSEISKQRQSEKLKGKKPWNSGKKLSEEHKQKISNSLIGNNRAKGKKLSEETKIKMSISHKGKKHSEEWNKKVGDAQRGKPKSKKAVEKMRNSKKGQKLSKEHKQKIGEVQKGLLWWTNGIINKKSKNCPGEGFTRGRNRQKHAAALETMKSCQIEVV